MDRKLTCKERKQLEKLHRTKNDKRQCDRIKAILLYDQDYSYAEIAQILLLDDETIRRHVKDFFKRNKLKPENGDSHSALNEQQASKLIAHLQAHTYCYVGCGSSTM